MTPLSILTLFPVMWFFLDLYQKGVTLPCPVKMLGGLDLEDEEEYDVEDTICLRQTEEYGTFLYLFLKSVVPAATMRDRCQNFLLSAYVTVNLEAYAILTYVNRSVHTMTTSAAAEVIMIVLEAHQ